MKKKKDVTTLTPTEDVIKSLFSLLTQGQNKLVSVLCKSRILVDLKSKVLLSGWQLASPVNIVNIRPPELACLRQTLT